MKLKYIISGLFASALLLPACVEVDEPNILDNVGSEELKVIGHLVNGYTSDIPSTIDPATGTIVVQVPYYISDTEPIMGDLTQMKVEATMPVGYSFSPSIAGIHDLTTPLRTNLVDNHGNKTPYSIIAEPTKSNACSVLSAKLTENDRVPIAIRQPANANGKGTITILRISSSVDEALKSVQAKVSPWSTIQCSGYDEATGIFDLSALPTITIVAQDGVTKTVYDVKFEDPAILDKGVGYITNLFGMQFYKDNDLGLTACNHSTLAVVNDYLILSNHSKVSDMIVLDRYTGKKLNVKVNTTGMPTDREFRAICHDDANHLVAISFTCSANFVTDPNVRGYYWKDGIENPPTSFLWANINGGYFAAGASWPNREMFYNINCRGDVTSGDAVIASCSLQSYRCWFIQLKDGKQSGNCAVEYAGGMVSMWSSSNCAPITNKPPYSYIWHSGNFRANVVYVPEGTAGNRAIDLTKPKSHLWGGNTHAVDYIEFNGAHLMAVSDGNDGSGATVYQRLYVTDLGSTPTASSYADGFIFDSREGGPNGTDDVAGTGYGVKGMTSQVSFEAGREVLGDNFFGSNRAMGDVKFARDPSGNAVQVYMLTPDQGILAYEITRFDL